MLRVRVGWSIMHTPPPPQAQAPVKCMHPHPLKSKPQSSAYTPTPQIQASLKCMHPHPLNPRPQSSAYTPTPQVQIPHKCIHPQTPSAAYAPGTTPTFKAYGNVKCTYPLPHSQMSTVSSFTGAERATKLFQACFTCYMEVSM